MYQVIKMYGDCEPWWFFDGWEQDIVEMKRFEHYEDALSYYRSECIRLSKELPQSEVKETFLAAFWDPRDVAWCDDCEENLQQYHSLCLMETKKLAVLNTSPYNLGHQRTRFCQIRKKK